MQNELTQIRAALISVYHKDNLEPVIRALHKRNITLYSTGGTEEFIKRLNIPVIPVEDLTSFPEILGGRVKTLHPKVFGGILGRRELPSDVLEMDQHQISPIDLVIVDLYPFEDTVQKGESEPEIIEKIDIGGISLIRAAAKNHKDVLIVPSRKLYPELLHLLENQEGKSSFADRRKFAAEAFAISSHYDTAIFNYFNQEAKLPLLRISKEGGRPLRYGENPHQKAMFFGNFDDMFDKLSGKDLSYNNLLDVDAASDLIEELSPTSFAIIKHNNACGAATRDTQCDAWKAALQADPISAFGGILVTNRELDENTAKEINTLFFEVLIAPSFHPNALTLLTSKPNRILLIKKKNKKGGTTVRSLLNGYISQDRDLKTETSSELKCVTEKSPSEAEIHDLLFANKLVKHTKSNTIILVKNNQLLASGTGQTSRVDALKQAIEKAKNFEFDLRGAVMASDAFFPFPDCVEIADLAGITAIIQPGGSVKDKESISYCNAHNLSMVFTGTRHFKH